MILTLEAVIARNIVANVQPKGQKRKTTYDATVFHILYGGKEIKGDKFRLPPRGIVWLVSRERFALPADITGLATLRTTWTHEGVLALNVGVVDPGWDGPLSAAVVNFSKEHFTIEKGDAFLRILFMQHEDALDPVVKTDDQYLNESLGHSAKLPSTFLDVGSLSTEVLEKIWGLPRWAVWVGFAAVVGTLLAVAVPIGWSSMTDLQKDRADIRSLEVELRDVRASTENIKGLETDIAVLKATYDRGSVGAHEDSLESRKPKGAGKK